MAIGVDPACYDLADHFLEDVKDALTEPESMEHTRKSLAEAIQQAVEDWFGAQYRGDDQ